MNDKFSYTGVVTLVERVNNKIVSKRYYNNGENRLFEAYARALSGQPITNYIPQYINIFDSDDNQVNTNPIPVIVNYKDTDTDGGNYGVPYTRVSVIILKNMINIKTSNSETETEGEKIKLYSSSTANEDTLLASTNINGILGTINGMASGVQLIVLWDLYVKNGGNE